MGSGSGYEYSYNLRVDDDIIPEYYRLICDLAFTGSKCFLFEFRTNFKLKPRVTLDNGDGIKTMISERFGVAVQDSLDEKWLQIHTNFRLRDDYRMSDDEILSMLRDALDLAKSHKTTVPVTPVVVDLDVWTVQREGESMDAAMNRAINVDKMMPLMLWRELVPKGRRVRMKFNTKNHEDPIGFLKSLSRIRVEDEAGVARANSCKVCFRDPVIGDQISFLYCGHSCHSLCLFKWMRKGYFRCPFCANLI